MATEGDLPSFERLASYAGQDFGLTKRAVIAAGSLGFDSKAANEYVELVLQHRTTNNGFDDPSGFASTLDACVAQAYLNTPGQITLLDGSTVDRRTHALSTDETIGTLLAAADVYAMLCLPKSGLDPVPLHVQESNHWNDGWFQTVFPGYITFDRSTDIRFGAVNYSDFDQQQLTEIVHKAMEMLESESIIEYLAWYRKTDSKDIRDKIDRLDLEAARNLDSGALDELMSFVRPIRASNDLEVFTLYALFDPVMEHHLKNFSVIEHPLAAKVRDLAKGDLTDNPFSLSLDPDNTSFAVSEMDEIMAKSQHISTLPVHDRSFAANTGGLFDLLSGYRFEVASIKSTLVTPSGNSPFRSAGYASDYGELPSRPPEEEMLLYLVGFLQTVHAAFDVRDYPEARIYNPEMFGFIMTTDGARVSGGDDQAGPYSKVFKNRTLVAMGEPYVTPADEFSLLPSFFVNRAATERAWEVEHIHYATGEPWRQYGKAFLLAPHYVDEPYDREVHPIDFRDQMTGYWLEVHNNVGNLPPE